MLELLPKEFVGVGEVRGFSFSQIASTERAYVYAVTTGFSTQHYEVFKRNSVPKCLDFTNRIYSETDFKESYPGSGQFGRTAFTFPSLEMAMRKMEEITESCETLV